jgi:cytochrome c biogenesis protein CcmG/thiol:disulfide interchange protein DsbE
MAPEQADALPSSIPRRFGRVGAVLLAGLLIALLAYGLTTTSSDDTIDQSLASGRAAPAPGFDLELLEAGKVPPRLERKLAAAGADGKISTSELRGAAVVLNYWASWCAPCAEEARVLEQGWKRWGRRGVVFIGLDMQDLRDDARTFLGRHGVDYPTIRDPGKKAARSYGATGIPETYFISGQGNVVAHCVGVVSEKQLGTGLAAALARRPLRRCRGGALRPSR